MPAPWRPPWDRGSAALGGGIPHDAQRGPLLFVHRVHPRPEVVRQRRARGSWSQPAGFLHRSGSWLAGSTVSVGLSPGSLDNDRRALLVVSPRRGAFADDELGTAGSTAPFSCPALGLQNT